MADLQSVGRINLSSHFQENIGKIPGFQYETAPISTATMDGIRGNWEPNTLNQTFFSQANFQIIQNKIRYEVYKQTGVVIDPQSTDDLFMVMRAIYLTYGRNLPNKIVEQIEELNGYVADWCVPKIAAEVGMYGQYLNDISTLPVPLSHPVNQSSAGSKSLPFKPPFGVDTTGVPVEKPESVYAAYMDSDGE
jgi:hypothetical protein